MADFKHLAALRVEADATVDFTFFRIAGEPTLTVRPAGDTNPDFFNAALRANKKAQRAARGRRGQTPTPESIERARQADITIFADTIVTGWSGVMDSDGNEVEFSRENLVQFLNAIPPDMFNELRNFCLDIDNFRDAPEEMDEEELEDLQGN